MRIPAAVLGSAFVLWTAFQDPQRPGTSPATPPRAESPAPATAPKADPADVASVDAILEALYDVISGPAGKARDWARMRSLFHPDARLVPMLKAQDGGMRSVLLKVDDYITRSGPMLERDGFFEQEIARRVDAFGDFAHVFSTYEGRRKAGDAEPFLRGINSIQLVRQQGRWFVLQILWEQEADAGPIPPQYLPAK
ncbi:MAG: DUF4440 domain-containing protein [Planctomycetes bacterium]|nr:DUF4440 domain-containing protein [Planctomycetota bacterium]